MFGLKRTRTLAELEVSPAIFDTIAAALREAGYDHSFIDGMIDMTGIGLTRAEEEVKPAPVHRPISRNSAPGAI